MHTACLSAKLRGFLSRGNPFAQGIMLSPFCDIAVIALSSSLELALQKAAQQLSSYLIELSKSEFSDVPLVIFGPFEAPVYKVDSKYRIRTVIKCRLNKRSRELFSRIIKNFSTLNTKNVNISVDFNPSTL